MAGESGALGLVTPNAHMELDWSPQLGQHRGTRSTIREATPKTLGLVHSKAKARVSTGSTGTSTINMNAGSSSAAASSVTIHIKAGLASAQCSAQEPPKKKQEQPKPTTNLPMLLLPPWDSAKL
nr:unnamed protein product [Digitaria exilis]